MSRPARKRKPIGCKITVEMHDATEGLHLRQAGFNLGAPDGATMHVDALVPFFGVLFSFEDKEGRRGALLLDLKAVAEGMFEDMRKAVERAY